MARNQDDLRGRLRSAALELYRQRGYDRTTAAEIAGHAGVTERTFFRYFPDKREVLFSGESDLLTALDTAIAQAPDKLGALETLRWALRSFEQTFENNRAFTEPVREVIDKTPALQERELAKQAAMTAGLASALKKRGVEGKLATLAARAAMAALNHATTSWIAEPSVGLGMHLDNAFEALRGL